MKKSGTKTMSGQRGSAALPGEVAAPVVRVARVQRFEVVRWDLIMPSPTNPRKFFDPVKLRELADTIAALGIQQPLLVRPLPVWSLREPDLVNTGHYLVFQGDVQVDQFPATRPGEESAREKVEEGNRLRFELVAGERRWRAAELAGLTQVPVMISELLDPEVLEIQYIENLQRQDLTALEEAEGFKKLIDSGVYTPESLAEKLGKSRSHIFGRLKLMRASGPVMEALKAGQIEHTVAELLGRVPGEKLQAKALAYVLDEKNQIGFYDNTKDKYIREPMSFRKVKAYLEEKFVVQLKGASFDPAAGDYLLFGKKGTCTTLPSCEACPKRSANCREDFPDIESPDVCTDPECFASKVKIHDARIKLELTTGPEPKAVRVLTGSEAQKCFDWNNKPSVSQGYVGADTLVPGTKKSVKDLLKKDLPTPVIAIVGGKHRQIWDASVIEQKLKSAGIKAKPFKEATQREIYDHQKEMEERAAKKKVSDAVAAQARPMLLAAVAPKLKTIELLRLVAVNENLFQYAMHNGIAEPAVAKKISKMSEHELCMLLYEIKMCNQMVDYSGGFYVHFTEECKRFGIDLKKVGNELKLDDQPKVESEKDKQALAEARARAKAAKKGAKKK